MWLYVPNVISSPSAQASEGLTLASSLPSPTLDLLEEVWFTWRGKRRQPRLWSRLWKRGGFIRRLSGLICEPSTLNHGVDRFISSLAATPAKTIALPEKEQEPMAIDFSPPKSAELPPSAGLILSSAKTYRGIATGRSKPSSQHWKDWAIALRQEYSRRPKPAIPCGGNDCSSWPTPTVQDSAYGEIDQEMVLRRMAAGKQVGLDIAGTMNWHAPRANDAEKRGEIASDPRNGLVAQGQQWEAPSVAVTDGTRLTRGGDRSNELLLTGQADQAAKQWASPMAADDGHKVTPNSHQNSLIKQAHNFTLPPSSPGRPIAGGSMSSTDGPNSNQPSAKRRINPIFVEALMRWPTGLSGFERQETAWTRWWQLMPSYLSVLCSRKPDSQTSLFD